MSLIALAILLIRIVWPTLNIDSISLGLLALAILPWLAPLIKSAEFPGGIKIEFQDIQAAVSQVTGAAPSPTLPAPSPPAGGVTIAVPPGELRLEGHAPTIFTGPPDANLDLVTVRIEIEKRLRRLAESAGIPSAGPLSLITSSLAQSGILTTNEASGLRLLVQAGNQAAHGAFVEPEISSSVRNTAPAIIALLDKKISNR